MISSEFLTEKVNDTYVYHSVGHLNTMIKMLQSGIINAGVSDHGRENNRNYPIISVSRDRSYRYPMQGGVAQFVIDRNELKKHGIKIRPFAFNAGTNTPEINGVKEVSKEEEILGPLPIRSPFVVQIEVFRNPTELYYPEHLPSENSKDWKQFLELAKLRNIPVVIKG